MLLSLTPADLQALSGVVVSAPLACGHTMCTVQHGSRGPNRESEDACNDEGDESRHI